MNHRTPQMEHWTGGFGEAYTNRNPRSPDEQDALYTANFGLSRSALNHEFLDRLDRSLRILEIGCNVGVQLMSLQRMGFSRLHGLEIQPYALEQARKLTRDIHLVRASAKEIPFGDAAFDLVFTSGVLIHISPEDIGGVLSEICRCAGRYIWGFEYFAETYTAVAYRGNADLMWKTDFARLYREHSPELTLVKERRVPYCAGDNVDAMFLLDKAGGA